MTRDLNKGKVWDMMFQSGRRQRIFKYNVFKGSRGLRVYGEEF